MDAICEMFGDYYGAGLNIPFEDEGSGKLTHVGGMCKLEMVFLAGCKYPL